MSPARAIRRRSPPLQRAQIVKLACLEPIAKGLHITHWASQDLARQAAADRIVSQISARSVRRILKEVDLQPHRTRSWKTSQLDAQFKERAEKILWGYAWAERLVRRKIWVVCADEMPNLQVLERRPIRSPQASRRGDRAKPGLIEHREFEYIRHGTVTVLMLLVVHTGQMQAVCLGSKSAQNYIRALRDFRRDHRHLRGVFLIPDNDPTHTAGKTQAFFGQSHGWWRPRNTPVHASWLNQAELLNSAFRHRYLNRGSWATRQSLDPPWRGAN